MNFESAERQGGYMEWTLGTLADNYYVRVGISYTNPNALNHTILYGWYANPNGYSYILEGSTSPSVYQPSVAGDVLKIAREGGMIKYYHNGVLRRSITDPQPSNQMLVDFSIGMNGQKIHKLNIKSNFKYEASVRTARDYSPFGVTLSGRNFTAAGAEKSRYGFQGQEMDDEVKGEGNSYDFGARMYDSRLGRWFSIDKLFAKRPYESSYGFVGENPIMNREIDGNDYIVIINHQTKTIIVKATYNVIKGDVNSFNDATEATKYWNKESGNYQLKVGKGENAVIYEIMFDLTVNETSDISEEMGRAYVDPINNSKNSSTYANSGKDGQNYFVTMDDEIFKSYKEKFGASERADGVTMGGNVVIMPKTKSKDLGKLGNPHEVGHTLGILHFMGTVMGKDDTTIKDKVSITLINVILGKVGLTNSIEEGASDKAQAKLKEENKTDTTIEIKPSNSRVKQN